MLLTCLLHANLREVMFREGREDDIGRLFKEPALAKRAVEYMINTRILPQFRWIYDARRQLI